MIVRVKETENMRLVRFWKRRDRLAEASVIKTATSLCVSRAIVSKVMSAYMNHGKTTAAKRDSGRKSTFTERDRRTFRIVSKIQELLHNRWQQNWIFILKTLFPQKKKKTVRRELHKSNTHGRAAIAKPLITESNVQMRKRWCNDHKIWTSDNWKRARVVWSNESSFMLFPTSGRV
jgi:hypothetical protein